MIIRSDMRSLIKSSGRRGYIICLSGIAFSLPLSEYLTSVFTILLLLNHLIMAIATRRVNGRVNGRVIGRNNVNRKINIPQGQKPLLIFLGGYLVYLLWVFNSADTSSSLFSLRLRLPLLVIPFVLFTSQPLSRSELLWISVSFIAGVVLSTAAGTFMFLRSDTLLLNTRDFSPFISHIRLSLMICFSLLLIFNLFAEGHLKSGAAKTGAVVLSLWLVLYMILMVSLTGLFILAVIMVFAILKHLIGSRKIVPVVFAVAIVIIIVALPVVYLAVVAGDYLTMKEPAEPDYLAITASGREYRHHTSLYGRENGYYTWNYICEEELAEGWNSISSIPYGGTDSLGHEVRFTLIRYLTSMGLRKDSAGVASLSVADVRLIEKGYANNIYLDGTGLHDRIYEIIWQIDHFAGGGNPQGHSVTQRLLFLKNGWRVFMRYPLLGTGTGDYINEVARQYEADNTILDPEFRRLPHNQYLTSLGTFGIAGALLFWLFMLLPALISGSFRKPLFIYFFLIMFLSMLTEDTLETHTGVTLFALFYSLLLLPAAVKGNRAGNSGSDQ